MAVMDYRTRDGLDYYGFSIEFQSDRSWRAYIVFESFQQGNGDILEFPYQSIDGNGRRALGRAGSALPAHPRTRKKSHPSGPRSFRRRGPGCGTPGAPKPA